MEDDLPWLIFNRATWLDWFSKLCLPPEYNDPVCGSFKYDLELIKIDDEATTNTSIPFDVVNGPGPVYDGDDVKWKFETKDLLLAGNCTQFIPGITCKNETKYEFKIVGTQTNGFDPDYIRTNEWESLVVTVKNPCLQANYTFVAEDLPPENISI